MNAHEIKKDFPVLDQEVNGKLLVYLDNAATSQKPQSVIDELKRFDENDNANVHRSVHTLGERATQLYEGARQKIADFIGAGSSNQIVFTRSATESLNLLSYAWARKRLKAGDEVVVTEMEHHSNLVSWQLACKDTGAELKAIPVVDESYLDLDAFESLLTDRTKIVALTHVSNVLGTINPVAEIAAKAREAGAIVVCDGAQAAPHLPVDVQALGSDFYVGTGHKMLGPTGIGFLWGREELLEEMDPFHGGGEMIADVWIDKATYNEVPYKFEAGTPPYAQAIGLGKAIDYLNAIGMKAVRDHEVEITRYALEQLGSLKNLHVYGPKDADLKGAVASFNHAEAHAHDVGTILDGHGVAVRAGHHCAKPLMRKFGVAATVRASFHVYNTPEDVDRLVEGLAEVDKLFG